VAAPPQATRDDTMTKPDTDAPQAPLPATATKTGPRRLPLRAVSLVRNGIVFALAIEIVIFALLAPNFLTVSNLRLVFLQTSVILILAVPSAILLFAGYVDFAVGSMVGLTAVILGRLLTDGTNVWIAGGIVILIAIVIGLFQGLLVGPFGFPTFVVTLGFFTALRGLAFVINDGKVQSRFGDTFAVMGRGLIRVLEIPVPIAIALVVLGVGAFVLYQTKWGRHIRAIGINETAAFRAGIRVKLIPTILYGFTAAAAGLGAIISVSRLDAAPPTIGEGLELSVLSAVLLGGVAFSGGRGNLLGVFAGVLFIGILNNGLLQVGVPPFWFRVVSGVALVVAAALDGYTKKLEARAIG